MRSCTGFTIIRKHGRPMNHYFVFAGTGAALYSRNMPFPTFRRLVSTVTAALFLFSAVAHHVVATGMSTEAGMAMPVQAAGMAEADSGMPCPMSSDCSKDTSMIGMACAAHCATVLGILAEAVIISVSITGHRLDSAVAFSLASLHGPPEPPPPKSHA